MNTNAFKKFDENRETMITEVDTQSKPKALNIGINLDFEGKDDSLVPKAVELISVNV